MIIINYGYFNKSLITKLLPPIEDIFKMLWKENQIGILLDYNRNKNLPELVIFHKKYSPEILVNFPYRFSASLSF